MPRRPPVAKSRVVGDDPNYAPAVVAPPVQGVVVGHVSEMPPGAVHNPVNTQQPLPQGQVVAVVSSVPMIYAPIQVTVQATAPQRWPFPMQCSICFSCSEDPGLCCYATLCTSCLNAELAEHIGARAASPLFFRFARDLDGKLAAENSRRPRRGVVARVSRRLRSCTRVAGARGMFGSRTCCDQWWNTCLAAFFVETLGNCCFFGTGFICGPWIWSGWYAMTRDAIKNSYRLPNDELCGSRGSIMSFLPWYMCLLMCHPCAVYQEAYYVKHALKRDYTCCCYANFFRGPIKDEEVDGVRAVGMESR